jgi:hypothetical protein
LRRISNPKTSKADQQSENVELAVIAQRLVQEAVRRAHAHHRDS